MPVDWILAHTPWVVAYLVGINLIAIAVTLSDKRRARSHRRRVYEATLFFVAAMGGAAGMYLTMLTVRHKTRHLRFMLGLPLILAVQIGGVIWLMMR